MVMSGVFSSVLTVCQSGNSSIWAWPPSSCSTRVFVSVTVFQVTWSRYGLPFCQ